MKIVQHTYTVDVEVFGPDDLTFDELCKFDFVWNVSSYNNAGHTIQVQKGNPVFRQYYRDAFVKMYDDAGNVIPYSQILITELYDKGIIIKR